MELPALFISRTKAILGDEWTAFEQALQEESPVSIRLNPNKAIAGIFSDFAASPVSWANNAYYLNERPSFTLDPLFHAGCYYVQEASSMYLEQIIQRQVPHTAKVLDLCAAPGGKATQAVSTLPAGSLLTANEVIRSRAYILSENLTKWGNPHTIVTNNDPKDFGSLPSFFDVIMADVPCSGEGMFRKDPAAISEWSLQNVQLCAERQKHIIADVWPALQSGGLFIYSTCTYNREENEDNIEWMCRTLSAEIVEAPRRFMPHQTKGEGFFIAAVRKNPEVSEILGKPSEPVRKTHQARNDRMSELLAEPANFTIISEQNTFTAIPNIHLSNYQILKKHLKILSAGVGLGETKGKDFIPAHSLALSKALNRTVFPTWELDKEAALHYLRKEAFQDIPPALPKGYVLVTYKNQPLGFIKNIGNRANNLYPSEWRIRNL
ncbi:MAG: Ribosomal RNA small subunit methyltransferase F [Candidatus Ordinivivax streblomastigis]|uniref:Ribosomal RNA small subunit methyltransferase F n=1 Tax=Candidatus Ordinivivax streblomastigis TaxID=2540710 RepID=A0A5M8P5E8_9BACT|nr:MAG: Ribosomal RNA small subunit methyltransferase F [Candidatus Ordinivivax streblomastigis]